MDTVKGLLIGYAVAFFGGRGIALLAQTSPDPISGGAGWVGAGLLGAVMAWLLLVHLPSKDKQLKEFIDGRDRDAAELRKTFTAEQEAIRAAFIQEQAAVRAAFNHEQLAQRDGFAAEQKSLRDQHGRELGEMRHMVVTVLQHFRTAVHDVRDTAQTSINRITEAELTAKKGDKS